MRGALKNVKKLIVYTSVTGFTKQYVQWIAEATGADVIAMGELSKVDVSSYPVIVYGGGIKAGNIRGLKKFKRSVDLTHRKKVIVFATGGAPNTDEIMKKIIKQNFTHEEAATFDFFYFQSGLNYERMKKIDRCLMAIYRKVLGLKKGKNATEKGTSQALMHSYDYSDKDHILPLVTMINEA
ncbi:MAG: hypothetical protein EA374_02105 [Acholeplasmatales bacterium]|nr:MAG: hypothetical protein EA374_02105 [Acholeplasmatales bacterium]